MKTLIARAPAKTILFGEHYVVYGAEGIACGIEPYNSIEFAVGENDAAGGGDAGAGFEYSTQLGKMKIGAGGAIACPQELQPAAAAYNKAAEIWPAAKKMRISATITHAWEMKGVGNSASLCAALASGIAACAGKEAAPGQCFDVAQESDKVAHGGSPSGIDAAAVSYGGAMSARKIFGKKISYEFRKEKFAAQQGWGFLIVNTLLPGMKRAGTAAQIAKFATAHKIRVKPEDVGALERAEMLGEYSHIPKLAKKALSEGKMETVAGLMNENHALLMKFGMGAPSVEKAVATARAAGAAGAKITGAGGDGSAVLVLAQEEKLAGITKALSKCGFSAREFMISKKGAHAMEKKE